MSTRRTRSTRSSSGTEAHERRQQRLQARREAKERALEAQRRAELRSRVLRIGVMVVSAVALLLFLWRLTTPASTPDRIAGHTIRKLGESGTGDHTTSAVDYDSSPPTHGPHHPQPAPCG